MNDQPKATDELNSRAYAQLRALAEQDRMIEERKQLVAQLEARARPTWQSHFTDRELKEIAYCQLYQRDFAHGTDGHNIRLIVAKLASLLDS